jgi:hypothetical protein
MTKSESKQVQTLEQMHLIGGDEANIALSLSALIRAARTKKSEDELLCLAMHYFRVSKHPEFKIC